MKKNIFVYFFIIILLIVIFQPPKGDINFDTKINALDLILLNRYVKNNDCNFNFIQLYMMDINNDYVINNEDLTLLNENILESE